RQDICTYIQAMLKKVGIRVVENAIPNQSYGRLFSGLKYDALIGAWGWGLKLDLTSIWHSTSGRKNLNSYSNPVFDAACEQALAEFDRQKATKLWQKAQETIVADDPYTFLFIPKMLNIVSSRVENVNMETIGWNYHITSWTLSR
ncbi:MAG: hypothetical protein AAF517_11855, partial [Planctomycetota bacterium]